MNEPTHAPGWRGRPPYYGDLEGQTDQVDRLERMAVAGCALMAGASMLIAAFVWGADLMAGHL